MNIPKAMCKRLLASASLADIKQARRELELAPDSSSKREYLANLDDYINEYAHSGLDVPKAPNEADYTSGLATLFLLLGIICFIVPGGLCLGSSVADLSVGSKGTSTFLGMSYTAINMYAGLIGLILFGIGSAMKKQCKDRYLQAKMDYQNAISLASKIKPTVDLELLAAKKEWLLNNFDSLFPAA